MTMRLLATAALAAASAAVYAADTAWDFETESEIRSAPRLNRRDYRFGVTNMCASSGRNSFFLAAPAWEKGMYEWPAFTLKSPVSDWSGYDRLSIDVVNLGDDGDMVSLRIAGPDGKTDLGLARSFALPAWGHGRWIVDLAYWPRETSPTNIARLYFYTGKPQSMCAFFDRITLLRPGDPLPPEPVFDAASRAAMDAGRRAYDARRAGRRAAFVSALAAENAAAGISPDGFLVGQASSMDGVRPKDTYAARGPGGMSLSLARGESEALQVLVTPTDGDLEDVSVRVSALKLKKPWWKRFAGNVWLPSGSVRVSAMGYVKTESRPRYSTGYNVATNEPPGYRRLVKRTPLGWWPDIILDFMASVPVKAGDVQSFWVDVCAPRDAVPGVYEGVVTVSAAGRRSASLPFSVRVYGFEIPKLPPIPVMVSFSPGVYVRPDQHGARDRVLRDAAAGKPDSPVNAWKARKLEWGDFLADRFVTMMPIYQHGGELPYDVWDRLKSQGRMGYYNLCYFSPQPLDDTPERRRKWNQWSDWVAGVIARRWQEAKAHGLETNCVFYCCDETRADRLGEVDAMLAKLKGKFPEIPFATTAYDDSFGTGIHLREMDIFIPQTVKFDSARAARSRDEGHKVWWYYACDQRAPLANAFTEGQPIEQRLLMGAMSAKWRPDGFLYYQMAYFNSLDCVTSGPYTSWNPRSWWNQHGDASWVAVGPGGKPLSTQRFENFRDGLEDLWYAELLRRKLAANPSAPWAARAKALLEVPRSVVDTLSNYTDDAKAVYAWRDGMAELLCK